MQQLRFWKQMVAQYVDQSYYPYSSSPYKEPLLYLSFLKIFKTFYSFILSHCIIFSSNKDKIIPTNKPLLNIGRIILGIDENVSGGNIITTVPTNTGIAAR